MIKTAERHWRWSGNVGHYWSIGVWTLAPIIKACCLAHESTADDYGSVKLSLFSDFSFSLSNVCLKRCFFFNKNHILCQIILCFLDWIKVSTILWIWPDYYLHYFLLLLLLFWLLLQLLYKISNFLVLIVLQMIIWLGKYGSVLRSSQGYSSRASTDTDKTGLCKTFAQPAKVQHLWNKWVVVSLPDILEIWVKVNVPPGDQTWFCFFLEHAKHCDIISFAQ